MVGGAVVMTSCLGGRIVGPDFKLKGEFSNVEYRQTFHTIKGQISVKVNYDRKFHKGIKVRLQGHLKSTSTIGANNSHTTVDTSEDVFHRHPIEILLKSGGAIPTRLVKMDFDIYIPRDRVYPTPFITPNASFTYKLIALIHYDGWQTVGQKVVKFMGFHNIIGKELAPFVEQKVVDDGKVTSLFTVPNTKVVMGCNETLTATLKLNGKIDNRVNATLRFVRNITYKRNKETHEIWSNVVKQTDQSTDVSFNWSLIVPEMARASYSYALYSVQYFLKYEVTLAHEDPKENVSPIVEGLIEIEVGTARLLSLRPSAPFVPLLLFRSSEPALLPSAPPANKDVHPSAPSADKDEQPDEDIEPSAPQGNRGMQLDKSVMSLFSLLSLPPAYSDLRPRSGSVFSIETQPPSYDDL